MNLETKYFEAEIKALDDESDDDIFFFEGYANIFNNIDNGNDMMIPGAFTKTIQQRGNKVGLYYMHDRFHPMHLLGGAENIEERDRGLYSKNWIALRDKKTKTPYPEGIHTADMIRRGVVTMESIGYQPIRFDKIDIEGKTVRRLKEVKLSDITVCPIWTAMNEEAQITAFKSLEDFFEYIKLSRNNQELKNKILSLLGISTPELSTTSILSTPEEATTLKANSEGLISLLKKKMEVYNGNDSRRGKSLY